MPFEPAHDENADHNAAADDDHDDDHDDDEDGSGVDGVSNMETSSSDSDDETFHREGRKFARNTGVENALYRAIAEVVEQYVPPGYMLRPFEANKASHGRRSLIPCAMEKLGFVEVAEEYLDVVDRNAVAYATGGVVDAAHENALLDWLRKFLIVPKPVRAPPKRQPRFFDVNGALLVCDNDEAYFQRIFRLPSAFLKKYASLLFRTPLEIERKTKVFRSSEMQMLLVTCRLGGYFHDWDAIARFFGIDESTLTSFFAKALDSVAELAREVLRVADAFRRCRHRGERYRAAMASYIRRKFGDDAELHRYYEIVRVIVDGLRLDICRSGDNAMQNVTWSGYTKSHCLLFGVFVTLCGLILGVTEPLTGRSRDPDFITQDVRDAAGANNLPVLCDSIFRLRPGVIIPIVRKEDLVAQRMQRRDNVLASSVRVAVEHVIGDLQRMFGFVFQSNYEHKLGKGRIKQLVDVSILIYDLSVCEYGNQVTLAFRCRPPTGTGLLNLNLDFPA